MPNREMNRVCCRSLTPFVDGRSSCWGDKHVLSAPSWVCVSMLNPHCHLLLPRRLSWGRWSQRAWFLHCYLGLLSLVEMHFWKSCSRTNNPMAYLTAWVWPFPGVPENSKSCCAIGQFLCQLMLLQPHNAPAPLSQSRQLLGWCCQVCMKSNLSLVIIIT